MNDCDNSQEHKPFSVCVLVVTSFFFVGVSSKEQTDNNKLGGVPPPPRRKAEELRGRGKIKLVTDLSLTAEKSKKQTTW